MPTRRLTSPDPVLHRIAPFGLAAAAGTAIVVDLDPVAPPYPGPTLADLIDGDLRSEHLRPRGNGVAVIANGGVEEPGASTVLAAISSNWPSVVIRVPWGADAIPVLPLEPAELRPARAKAAVWQSTGPRSTAPGVVLPPLRRSAVRSLCRGTVEPRSRWVRAWNDVWTDTWA